MRSNIALKVITWVILAVAAIIFLFPFLFFFITSIKTNPQTMAVPPVWVFEPDWSHFGELLFSHSVRARDFRLALINSMVIALSTTGASLAIGFPAAYSISRFKTGGSFLASWILSFRMIPPIIFLIPMFILYMNLGLMDTHWALIIIYTTFNLPFTIWVLKSFIDDIPLDFEEAAMVDGCTRLRTMYKITLPLCAPGIIAVGILNFTFSWNEFLFAFVFTTSRAITLPAQSAIFITQYTWLWADLCASVVVMLIPLVIFWMIIQKKLIRGLTMGAIKG